MRYLGHRLTALVLVASGWVGIGFDAPAHAAEVTITWPEITQFNPSTTDYVIDLDYDGDGTLWLTGGALSGAAGLWDEAVPLPTDGPFRVEFPPVASDDYILAVAECPPPSDLGDDCRLAGLSPHLQVYSWFQSDVRLGARDPVVAPSTDIRFDLDPLPDGPVDVAWEVRPSGQDDAEPVLAGSVMFPSVDGSFRIDDPDHLLIPGARYLLTVHFAGDYAPYGRLVSRWSSGIQWPGVHDPVLILDPDTDDSGAPAGTFYPEVDGFGDTIDVHLYEADSDIVDADFEIADAEGAVVYERSFSGSSRFPTIHWNGQANGQVLPGGDYLLTVRSTGLLGTQDVDKEWIHLERGRLVTRNWRATFTPEETLTTTRVGACGWIKTPARATWVGSIGLYTADRCRGAGRGQRFAISEHRIDIPWSPTRHYAGWITFAGGKARSEDSSELRVRYRTTLNGTPFWTAPIIVPGERGPYRAEAAFIGYATATPSITWEARVQGGDRYDLREVSVDISVEVLE